MNPLSVRARSFRSFESLEVELPSGCTAIIGSNGSGKSSLVSIIDLALFGPESRSLADCLSDDAEDTELEIELCFEHAGETYRVRRGFSARGRGKSTTDFEIQHVDLGPNAESEFEPLTLQDQKATDALIERTLGLSRTTFRASCFLAQGDSGAFTEAQPRERKAILGEVLGLSSWARLLDLAKGKRRAAQQQLDTLAGRIGAREEEIARMPEVEQDVAGYSELAQIATKELASAELSLERTREVWVAAEARLSERRTAEAKLQAAKNALAPLEEALAVATLARGMLSDTEGQIAVLTTSAQLAAAEQAWSEARAEWDRVAHERQVIEAKIANAQQVCDDATAEWERLQIERASRLNEAAALDAHDWREDAQACALCKRPLNDPVARQAVVEAYRGEAKEIEGRMIALNEAAREHEARIVAARDELAALRLVALPDEGAVQKARADQSERARLEERIAAWRRQIEDVEKPGFDLVLSAAREEVALAEKLLAELPMVEPEERERIQRQGLEAKAAVEAKREELRIAGEAKARAEAELERLALLAAETAADRRTRDELLAEVDVLATLERAYGPNGVSALIVENVAIPQIEVEAQKVLARLGGKTAGATIELRTQRALKSSDGLAETLDIVMRTAQGHERTYENWSEGEKTRLNLALRYGLAKLLIGRNADSGVFVLDEPEFLDSDGRLALRELVREIHADGVAKVFLVSQYDDLREAFDQVIEVVPIDETRSRIETGVTAEAVAA